MEEYLDNCIKSGENEQVAFIAQAEKALDLAKTICAFANTKGGRLLVGIRKNGKVIGTEPSENYSFITDTIVQYCKPHIEFDTHIHQVGYRIVLEIEVFPSTLIHKVITEKEKWIPFMRVGTHDVEAKSVLKHYLKHLHGTFRATSDELTADHQKLIDLLTTEVGQTLTQLIRKSSIKKEQIEFLLNDLIIEDMVQFEYFDQTLIYKLR